MVCFGIVHEIVIKRSRAPKEESVQAVDVCNPPTSPTHANTPPASAAAARGDKAPSFEVAIQVRTAAVIIVYYSTCLSVRRGGCPTPLVKEQPTPAPLAVADGKHTLRRQDVDIKMIEVEETLSNGDKTFALPGSLALSSLGGILLHRVGGTFAIPPLVPTPERAGGSRRLISQSKITVEGALGTGARPGAMDTVIALLDCEGVFYHNILDVESRRYPVYSKDPWTKHGDGNDDMIQYGELSNSAQVSRGILGAMTEDLYTRSKCMSGKE
ncbi:hypothetical protein BDZ97DRAFT_1754949 [Flammula alnicola]|nr:hypothetical protein BDZ97DRAFT_1754949 [Flammula alnicola]